MVQFKLKYLRIDVFNLLKKYWYILVLLLSYFVYAFYILAPSDLKSFSLIDDGQSIQNSQFFDDCFKLHNCQDLKGVLVEKQFGRFRPLYWTFQFFEYKMLGLNPELHHEYRTYLLGALVFLLICIAILQMGGGIIAIVLATSLFFGSFSFTENILRLGPVEIYQIIVMAIFSILFLRIENDSKFKLFALLFLAISAILIKETSFILIFPLITNVVRKRRSADLRHIMPIIVFSILLVIAGRIVSKPTPSALVYVDNFSFSVSRIISNLSIYLEIILNSTSPFAKLLLITVPLILFNPKFRKDNFNNYTYYWFFLMAFSLGILLPWKFILERYILLSLFCFSIIIGYLFDKFFDYIKKEWFLNFNIFYSAVFNLILFMVFSNLFIYGFSINLAKTINFKLWYRDYLNFEKDQVVAIAKVNGQAYINAKDNLDNWEVLYEIPIHLKYLYPYSLTKTDLIKDNAQIKGFLFSRSSLDSVVDVSSIKSKGLLIDSKSYNIDQIDPIKFKKEFILRPLTTFNKPPYKSDKISYYWEMRKI